MASDLSTLLAEMKPELSADNLVFCTIADHNMANLIDEAVLCFKEEEAVTVVLPQEIAESHGLPHSGDSWTLITLNVHSSLKAVGFLAEITKSLAKNEISVNVVSAFYHDHLLVLSSQSRRALDILQRLSHTSRQL